MLHNHNGYLNYELPDNWCVEENSDELFMYNPDGNGAMTTTFYNVLNTEDSLVEQISVLAKRFIDRNGINVHSPLVIFVQDGKTILCGTGITPDNWFVKLWVVAKHPKIVFVTYQSEQKNTEIKTCDLIIDSFRFTL